jgi:alkyl hydroperoxide reductase subunit AhpC
MKQSAEPLCALQNEATKSGAQRIIVHADNEQKHCAWQSDNAILQKARLTPAPPPQEWIFMN